MSLRGVRVLEFAGLAPGPFCGKILKDMGAHVIRIDKVCDFLETLLLSFLLEILSNCDLIRLELL